MFNNLDDEIEFFSTSQNLKAKIESIDDDEKIVIIDNFWKHPDKIRNLVLSMTPTFNPNLLFGLPGKRIETSFYFSHLAPTFSQIIQDVYPKEFNQMDSDYIQGFFDFSTLLVNIQTSDLEPRVPHMDSFKPGRFAVGIYLNTDDECSGGTAFYKFKGKKTITIEERAISSRYDYYVQESDGDCWEKYFLAEMKFNRMILYKQDLLHTPYILPDTFTEDRPRLMQMFFI